LRPLEGIRILDVSRLIAGGAAATLMADFGADVVKVEEPRKGDPLRQWTSGGQPYWWKVYARNKRYITLNLKSDEGKNLLRRLLPKFDAMIESFVPGTLEDLGLGWDTLSACNPKLILLRISGWGQSGPGSQRPGFGTLVEAASGFAAMNGEPDGAPIVPAFPLADMTSALYAANALMFALYHRDVHDGPGQVIDVSLFESLFSVLGPQSSEYAASGKLRGRQGSRSTNAAPRGCYPTKDGRWIAVSASTPKMAERFLNGYGLGHMMQDARFATNEARVQHREALDAAVSQAIAERTLQENLDVIEKHALTAAPVQTVADIEQDAHWRSRELVVDVPDSHSSVRMHNVTPRLSATPGEIRWAGGSLGQHNDEIYQSELGLDTTELKYLKEAGVI
jgi:crotonobetainyl-CoA:carnitine CoA-transferase CaiB-like acyl-CoA transferase